MNRREQILAVVLGAVTLTAVIGVGAQRLLLAPRAALAKQVAEARADVQTLTDRAAKLNDLRSAYSAAASCTLSPDPNVTASVLRREIYEMLCSVGFTSVEPDAPSIQTHGLRRDAAMLEAVVTMNAEGPAEALAKMLVSFYCRPYSVRLVHLRVARLTEEEQPTQVSVRLTVSAPVTPEVAGAAHPGFAPRASFPGAYDKASYMLLADDCVFEPWRAPTSTPEIVSTDFASDVEEAELETTDATPIVRPNKRIVGVEKFGPRAVALVRDDDEAAEEKYLEHSEFDDGELAFIHRTGVVVRVADAHAAAHVVHYFYAVGASFGQRELLSMATHPDVYLAYFGASRDN